MPARDFAAVPAAASGPAVVPAGAAALLTLFLSAAVLLLAIFSVGCAQGESIAGKPGDVLVPGVAVTIDLDGDGAGERVLLEKSVPRLVITDGSTVYRTREKWHLVEACLGDADGGGLPEVVALLDADDGRHLGLFAFVSGEYRERLITSVLRPRPLSLRVVARSADTAVGGSGRGSGALVVLTEEAGGSAAAQTTTYRWNGFGFTALTGGRL